jgi:hypothetical protein
MSQQNKKWQSWVQSQHPSTPMRKKKEKEAEMEKKKTKR